MTQATTFRVGVSLDELETKAKAATQKDWWVEDGEYPDRYGTSNALISSNCIYTRADAQHISAVQPSVVLKLIEVIRCYELALKYHVDFLSNSEFEYYAHKAKEALTHARKVLET